MTQKTSSALNLPTQSSSEFKIGVLLIKSGKITASDAREVVALSKNKGSRFGDAAVELGLVTQTDIDEVIAKQFDYTFLTASDEFSPELTSAFHPKSAEAEYIRGLRTQLMLNWFKGRGKALAISSVDERSGNSRFVANMAVAFSQLGKKTLLIDANLRNPVQHATFNLGVQERGLSDVLIGRAGLEAVHEFKAIRNLSLLPSGVVPPNPQELVSGKLFEDFIAFLSEIFDVILIDTPAYSVGADAQAIAATAGGTLLIVRKNITKAKSMTNIAKVLTNNGTKVVGSIITDF